MAESNSRTGYYLIAGGMIVLLAAIVGGVIYQQSRRPAGSSRMNDALELNNRGVGLMEQFKFEEAAAVFEQASAAAPDWTAARINQAIALYNQAKPEQIDRAIGLLEQVIAAEPKNPHAHFCLGFLLKYRTRLDEALTHFEVVTTVDPTDAGGWYHLAVCLEQLGQEPERMLECARTALRLNPYMNAAAERIRKRLFNTDPAKAQQMLAEMEQLRLTQNMADISDKYSDQGSKYAQVIGTPARPQPAAETPVPLFEPGELHVRLAANTRWAKAEDLRKSAHGALLHAARSRFGATLIRLDYNSDGKPDLLILSAVVENGTLRNLLLRNDGNLSFTDVTTEAGLAAVSPGLGVCAGDYNNDGPTDLCITTATGCLLFRNTGNASFEDVTQQAGLNQLTGPCHGCTWTDLDHDGDLDLLVGGAGLTVFINVGKSEPIPAKQRYGGLGTAFRRFPDLEKALGISAAVVGFAVGDLDADVDLDFAIFADGMTPAMAVNDRLLRFRRQELLPGLAAKGWNGALVIDVNQDGISDLLLLPRDARPTLLISQAVPGQDRAKLFEVGATNAPPLRHAGVVDLDLDGWPDVVGLSANGEAILLRNDRAGKLVVANDALGVATKSDAICAGDLDGDGNPDVLSFSESQGLELRRSRGNGNRSVKLHLIGKRDMGSPPTERTNNDAYGARVTLQSGKQVTMIERTTLSAGLGQSSVPLELGFGAAALNDAIVRIRWPDQSIQAEFLGVPKADFCSIEKENIWEIRQTNRKGTSCPVLLTWDGEKFVYITDFLGAGSVGELQAEGGTRPARGEESIKIESSHLKPNDGFYMLRVAEPMDEVTYLDQLRLEVIDLPPGFDVFPDERFATSGSATQALLMFRERWTPGRAVDHRGRDVTGALQARDGKYVAGFDTSYWLGFAEEHWVELDFGAALKELKPNDRVCVVLAGWTDYPYPESIFAATQAGVELLPPVLEQLGADGKWRTVEDLGFPAGLPRVMTRVITKKLAGSSGRLRIRTNMQIYWDHVFIAPVISSGEGQVRTMPVSAAELSPRGFLRELRAPGSPLIAYDPERLEPVAVNRWHGRFTRFGEVTELLREADDRHAIFGPGDELTVRFDARSLPQLQTGWTRQYVLRTVGWCKDASLFTYRGGDVFPLPFRGMKQYPPGPDEKYPHPGDLDRWHTRK